MCLITLDGTDCPILEPGSSTGNFSSRWYSHKFKGTGVRYEIWINIQTGDCVCPYPCGSHPAINIARISIVKKIQEQERILSDGGIVLKQNSKPPLVITIGTKE